MPTSFTSEVKQNCSIFENMLFTPNKLYFENILDFPMSNKFGLYMCSVYIKCIELTIV